jgi:large subunit ribosomal protein L30
MAKKEAKKEKVLRVTLVKSAIGYEYHQKRTLRALGLRRMLQTVEHVDTPAMRGMIAKVLHLVEVEEVV